MTHDTDDDTDEPQDNPQDKPQDNPQDNSQDNPQDNPQDDDGATPERRKSRGGYRPGAGRQYGTKNSGPRKTTPKTERISEHVTEALNLMGMDDSHSKFRDFGPIEVLQFVMRLNMIGAERANSPEQQMRLLQSAAAIARDLAPYVSPKLQSVDVNATVNRDVESLSDQELLAIIEQGRAKAR